jgi:heat shock protein HslJ
MKTMKSEQENQAKPVYGHKSFRFLTLLITLLFIFAACAPAPTSQPQVDLANSRWKLSSFGEAPADTSVIEGSMITLEFTDKGLVVGSGGCNAYSGPYTVQDGELRIGKVTSTLMACNEQAVSNQEGQYLQALQTASRFDVTESTLSIRDENDEIVLNFVRMKESGLPHSIRDESLLPDGLGEKQYELPAKTGQTLSVTVISDNVPLSIVITSPGGVQTFPEVVQADGAFQISHKIVVTETGDYRITLTKADQTPGTNYNVNLSIQ